MIRSQLKKLVTIIMAGFLALIATWLSYHPLKVEYRRVRLPPALLMNMAQQEQLEAAIVQVIGGEADLYGVQHVLRRLANKYGSLAYDASPAGQRQKVMLEIKNWVVKTTGVSHDSIKVDGPILSLHGIEYQRHLDYFSSRFEGKPEFVAVGDGVYEITSPMGKVEATYWEEPMYEGCTG